ncbi:MAG: T9SS type A sorting domain-containing protein [Bacteroidales bacterium]|nr:T9SS type A sorting domain-containing protein [Bacteroidales bacterium]
MKKVFTLFLALLMSIAVKAQCPLTEAVDFSTIDHHGNEINLFEILDGGQYVLIDFFYTSCGPCQSATPNIVDAYYALGCNQHEVFFMEISPSDHNNEPFFWIDNWIETYGIEYPTIYKTSGGEHSGEDICNMYQIAYYPTVILIAPNREIVVQDIWPVSSAQTVIDALAPFGIEEHECDEVQAPTIVFEVTREASYAIDAEFTTNATCSSYYVMASTNAELDAETVKAEGQELTEQGTHTFTGLTAETEYYIYGLPVNAEGEFGDLRSEYAKTKCDATDGVSTLELNVAVVPGYVIADALPNGSTSEYHYAFIKVSKYEEWGEEMAIFQLLRDNHPICGDDFWQQDIAYFESGVDYYCYGIGYNSEAELGELEMVRFNLEDGVIGINEVSLGAYNIFPNPATSTINIKSNVTAATEVYIYDMTGRCVKNVVINDNNATVNVEDLNKGVYFVNINGKIEKLVIE